MLNSSIHADALATLQSESTVGCGGSQLLPIIIFIDNIACSMAVFLVEEHVNVAFLTHSSLTSTSLESK